MQPSSGTSDGVAGELRSDARHVGTAAANRLHSEVDARKGAAASQARSVSSAIDRAAGDLDQSAPDWLRSAFQQGAQQVQRFADALEQKDSRELLNEVNRFARTSPGTFLAGCAAAGFAAARVLKAGAEGSGRPPAPHSTEYKSSFETTFGESGTQPGLTPSPRGEFV